MSHNNSKDGSASKDDGIEMQNLRDPNRNKITENVIDPDLDMHDLK